MRTVITRQYKSEARGTEHEELFCLSNTFCKFPQFKKFGVLTFSIHVLIKSNLKMPTKCL